MSLSRVDLELIGLWLEETDQDTYQQVIAAVVHD